MLGDKSVSHPSITTTCCCPPKKRHIIHSYYIVQFRASPPVSVTATLNQDRVHGGASCGWKMKRAGVCWLWLLARCCHVLGSCDSILFMLVTWNMLNKQPDYVISVGSILFCDTTTNVLNFYLHSGFRCHRLIGGIWNLGQEMLLCVKMGAWKPCRTYHTWYISWSGVGLDLFDMNRRGRSSRYLFNREISKNLNKAALVSQNALHAWSRASTVGIHRVSFFTSSMMMAS